MSDDVHLRLITGTPDQMAELQRVLEAAPGYAMRATGLPVGAADAQSTVTMLPDGKGYDDKFVFGIHRGDDSDAPMVGCIDVVRGWPDHETAMLGLLIVDERLHGQGIGRAAYRRLEAFVATWPEIRRVRIGVLDLNAHVAMPFWLRMGFLPNGETKPHRYAQVEGTIAVLVKPLMR